MKDIMKKIGLVVFSFSMFFLFWDSESAYAAVGDKSEVVVQYNVYTDVRNVDDNIAEGDFTVVTAIMPVKQGEVWNYETMLAKAKQYAVPALKKKTGKTYSIVDLVKNPIDKSYGDDIGKKSNFKKSSVEVQFYTDDYDYREGEPYKIMLNLFANPNGPLNGWKSFNGFERYYVNNVFKTGVQKVGQTTYLFDSDGEKQKGWHDINGHNMYFNEENGGLWTGKRKIGYTTYLFNSQGQKLYGWHRLNGKDYYFDLDNGGMWTGKRTIGYTTYLFKNEGDKTYGWFVNTNNSKYYFSPVNGGMLTGLRKIGNSYYYMDTYDGEALQDENLTINGKLWTFSKTGIGKIVK